MMRVLLNYLRGNYLNLRDLIIEDNFNNTFRKRICPSPHPNALSVESYKRKVTKSVYSLIKSIKLNYVISRIFP